LSSATQQPLPPVPQTSVLPASHTSLLVAPKVMVGRTSLLVHPKAHQKAKPAYQKAKPAHQKAKPAHQKANPPHQKPKQVEGPYHEENVLIHQVREQERKLVLKTEHKVYADVTKSYNDFIEAKHEAHGETQQLPDGSSSSQEKKHKMFKKERKADMDKLERTMHDASKLVRRTEHKSQHLQAINNYVSPLKDALNAVSYQDTIRKSNHAKAQEHSHSKSSSGNLKEKEASNVGTQADGQADELKHINAAASHGVSQLGSAQREQQKSTGDASMLPSDSTAVHAGSFLGDMNKVDEYIGASAVDTNHVLGTEVADLSGEERVLMSSLPPMKIRSSKAMSTSALTKELAALSSEEQNLVGKSPMSTRRVSPQGSTSSSIAQQAQQVLDILPSSEAMVLVQIPKTSGDTANAGLEGELAGIKAEEDLVSRKLGMSKTPRALTKHSKVTAKDPQPQHQRDVSMKDARSVLEDMNEMSAIDTHSYAVASTDTKAQLQMPSTTVLLDEGAQSGLPAQLLVDAHQNDLDIRNEAPSVLDELNTMSQIKTHPHKGHEVHAHPKKSTHQSTNGPRHKPLLSSDKKKFPIKTETANGRHLLQVLPQVGKLALPQSVPALPASLDPQVILNYENMLLKDMRSMQIKKGEGSVWSDVIRRIDASVVQLRVVQENFLWQKPYRQPMKETSFGSGWIIDNAEFGVDTGTDIIIVTNAHVAKQAFSIVALFPALGLEPVKVTPLGICVERDIALLKIVNPEEFLMNYKIKTGNILIYKNKLGDSDALRKGTHVMAAGYPLGMHGLKTTRGIVSGYEPMGKDLYLSITAPINPGNSGGPLYNSDGHVVGINSAKLTEVSRIAFAIPTQQVAMMLDALYTNRQYVVPDLGFKWSPGSANLNEFLTGIPGTDGGVYVREVMPGGIFGQAGVKENDILLAIDNHTIANDGKIYMKEIENDVSVHGMLTRKMIGSELVIHVYRGDYNASLQELKTTYDQTPVPAVRKYYETNVDIPRHEQVSGAFFMALSIDLVHAFVDENPEELVQYTEEIERFNVPRVIVTNVLPDSAVGKTGTLHGGTLVKEVNDKPITDMKSFCEALKSDGEFWTLRTAKTFTVLPAADVHADIAAENQKGSACAMILQSFMKGRVDTVNPPNATSRSG